MAPHPEPIANLAERAYCPYGYGYGGGCYSSWDYYGRWIFAAVAVFVFILILFIWACVNSRRRRRQGIRPMYGTGWMAGGPPQYQNNPNAYNNNPNAPGFNPPPAYGAPPGQSYPMQAQDTGATFRTADGYYGGHQEGVQPPKNVYGGAPGAGNANNATDYAPPPGPPPASTRP